MSEIEWGPWIQHTGEECPVDGDTTIMVRFKNGGESNGFSKAAEWPHWIKWGGDMEITHYRIPMEDYRRITGMPSWDDAPEWAQWLCQDPIGQWKFTDTKPIPEHEHGGSFWLADIHWERGLPGAVLGDWRDTLQERPVRACRHDDPDNSGLCIKCGANLDELFSHPESEPDADQYSVGADTSDGSMTAPDFLSAALSHMQDRASTYDSPRGERSMGKTVAAFNAITGHELSEEQGWLFMVLLKAVRTQQGGFRADNYEDGAAYFGLQGEAAHRERK